MATAKECATYITDLDKTVSDLDAWAKRMNGWVAGVTTYLQEVEDTLKTNHIPKPHGTGIVPPPPPPPTYP